VRIGLLVMMIAGLIFSSSLPLAFDSRGWAFAGSYFFMEVGRSLFFIWAARRHRIHRDNFLRILVWFTLGGLFWLAGAMCHDGWRLALWAVGLAVAYGSAWIGFWTPGLGCSSTRDWDIEGGHMAERCGLFMIISLGESVLVTGATFSELAWTAEIVTAFLVSIVGSMAMWWLYFSTNAEAASERFSKAADPGRVARLAYTYMHLLLVMGVILSAVADEVVLAHPRGHADLATLLVVLGAPAFFLLGNALFKWSIWGCLPASSMLGVGVLAAAAFVGPALAPLALLSVGTVVLLAVAVWEGRVSWCNRCLGGRPAPVD
jgi:low temperature requirement protein LtrA